MALIAYFLAY